MSDSDDVDVGLDAGNEDDKGGGGGGHGFQYVPYHSISKRAPSFRSLASACAWVATEKIHGTNMGVVLRRRSGEDDVTMTFARRTGLLPAGFNHFGHVAVDFTNLKGLYAAAVAKAIPVGIAGDPIVTVYGELYGGHWPGVEGPANAAREKPVQQRLWYRPDIAFSVFDISVVAGGGPDSDSAAPPLFLDFEDVAAMCDALRVPRVRECFRGGFQEAVAWAKAHAADDVVPHAEGLPALPPGTNPGEGWVVRTVRETRLPKGGGRALVKVKNPTFDVDINMSKHGPKLVDKHASRREVAGDKGPEPGLEYVTDCRAGSVVGKVGRDQSLVVLARALLADIVADAAEDGVAICNDPPPRALQDACFKCMRRYLAAEAAAL
jgi:Rnl2 family RNA ligase